MRDRPRTFWPHALTAAIVAFIAAASLMGARLIPLPNGDEYNTPGFIVRYSWVKFAHVATTPFRADVSAAEEDARVARFFQLNDLIGQAERVAADPRTPSDEAGDARARADDYRQERGDIENSVERIMEGRLTDGIRAAGLTREVGREIVWPPVSIEFEEPPSVLVKSPRDAIRKDSETLLKGDLSVARLQQIESAAERDSGTSALVVRIGAVATYPAIIPPGADYHQALEHAAHEWLHHYLFFTPLGRRYFDSNELTTLNETVANMGGRELACFVDPCEASLRASSGLAAPPSQEFDFRAEMRALRLEVEALLAEGRIEEAERRMEDKRRDFVANGYYIRRLNQAYFAFHGSYADTAASIDPIGPKLENLRERTGSLQQFVETARNLTSEAGLDALLRP